MKVIKANIADVKINPNNPRLIKDDNTLTLKRNGIDVTKDWR